MESGVCHLHFGLTSYMFFLFKIQPLHVFNSYNNMETCKRNLLVHSLFKNLIH